MSSKVITLEEFQNIKNEFITTIKFYSKNKENKEKESDQQESVISLLNQKEILLQKDFIQGMNFIKSQYELFEIFPLIGYAIRLKRSEGSSEKPWLVDVKFIAK